MTILSGPRNQKKLFLCVAVFALTALSFGQNQQTQALNPEAPVTQPACQSTFNYGSGQTLFNFCIAANGSLVQFTSPDGFEHIREGQVGEGYGICDAGEDVSTSYFDYAQKRESGNWSDPVITQPGGPNTFPLKITRATSDGAFTLVQSFTRNPSERIVKIAMTLKNTSRFPKSVFLLRFADIDANNADHGDFFNEFDSAAASAWGYNTGAYGMAVSAVPTSVLNQGIIWNTSQAPDPCASSLNVPNPPFFGDGSAGIIFYFPLAAGKSKTVSVEYQRF